MAKESTSISIVMLVYNEAEIIETVIRDYYDKVYRKLENAEFIVAEDGSADGTKDILARLAAELDIKLVSGEARKGYVKAYRDAAALPCKDVIFFTDSSGKHFPEDFWQMYPLLERNDIVSGRKVKRQDPVYRVLMTKIFNRLVNLYFGTAFEDIDSGFKLVRRKAMLDVLQDKWICTDLISFELMVRWAYRGYKIEEVPVRHRPRANGSSRGLPLKKIPKVIKMVLSNFAAVKKDAVECARRESVTTSEESRRNI